MSELHRHRAGFRAQCASKTNPLFPAFTYNRFTNLSLNLPMHNQVARTSRRHLKNTKHKKLLTNKREVRMRASNLSCPMNYGSRLRVENDCITVGAWTDLPIRSRWCKLRDYGINSAALSEAQAVSGLEVRLQFQWDTKLVCARGKLGAKAVSKRAGECFRFFTD
ncbi:hypothetical protein BaRGS_00032810 [Batillaria attramentaria]|uniref:Uncharacterized protein n=1 Tax=Batillaria attramentaria TaxID=370345 RepID=A0ABD0JMK8_9CAEN